MSLAVTASVRRGALAPTVPSSTALPEDPLAVTDSARGVEVESLLTASAILTTALVSLAVSVVSAPTVTAPE